MFPNTQVIRGVRYMEDGKIATSGGLTSGVDLAMRVVERYYGREVAQRTAQRLEYQGTGWMYPNSNAEFARRRTGTTERPICPVCEAQIERATALTWQHQDTTYYFCSDFCRDYFKAAPQRFLEKA